MDHEWKEQIDFAYTICAQAALPVGSYVDREASFRFVRALLMERYVCDSDSDAQRAYISEVFDDDCGGPCCCFCWCDMIGEESHNPAPLVEDPGARCCEACNMTHVIPSRLGCMRMTED